MKRYYVAAVLVAFGVAGGSYLTNHQDPQKSYMSPLCISQDIGSKVTEDQVADLIAKGWKGLATDNEERLYSPACMV